MCWKIYPSNTTNLSTCLVPSSYWTTKNTTSLFRNQPATMAYTSPYHVLLDLPNTQAAKRMGTHINVLLCFSPVELSGPSGPFLCVFIVKQATQTLEQKWSWSMFWIHDSICGTIYKFYLPLLRMTYVTWCGYKTLANKTCGHKLLLIKTFYAILSNIFSTFNCIEIQ